MGISNISETFKEIAVALKYLDEFGAETIGTFSPELLAGL